MEKGPVFGLNIGELLTIYDHDSQSWKMSECLFTGDYAKSSGPFPKSGIMLNGRIYEQATWAPRTEGKEYGLWRTPDTCAGGTKSKEQYEKAKKTGCNAIRLQDQIKHEVMFPTPRANDAEKRGQIANDPRNGLPAAVKYPTPRANKPEGYSSEGFRPTLAQVVTGEDKPLHGQLNPTWVDWLMGYPIGWTDLGDSETRLSLK